MPQPTSSHHTSGTSEKPEQLSNFAKLFTDLIINAPEKLNITADDGTLTMIHHWYKPRNLIFASIFLGVVLPGFLSSHFSPAVFWLILTAALAAIACTTVILTRQRTIIHLSGNDLRVTYLPFFKRKALALELEMIARTEVKEHKQRSGQGNYRETTYYVEIEDLFGGTRRLLNDTTEVGYPLTICLAIDRFLEWQRRTKSNAINPS